jgi:hypothetical protein
MRRTFVAGWAVLVLVALGAVQPPAAARQSPPATQTPEQFFGFRIGTDRESTCAIRRTRWRFASARDTL